MFDNHRRDGIDGMAAAATQPWAHLGVLATHLRILAESREQLICVAQCVHTGAHATIRHAGVIHDCTMMRSLAVACVGTANVRSEQIILVLGTVAL